MASAYMNINHFSLAEQVINDGLALSDKVSQLYFRKAPAFAYRRNASAEQLREASKLMERVLEMKPNEKIFSTTNKNILNMLNLHDVDEAYQSCQNKITERIEEVRRMYNRCER